MSDLKIYNCHVHTLTDKNAPPYLLKLKFGNFIGGLLSTLLRYKWFIKFLIWFLKTIGRGDNDILEREARFLEIGKRQTQEDVFKKLHAQYPTDAVFVVLPMDTKFMGLGNPFESVEQQHRDLLELAAKFKGQIIPFYAVDPRRKNIVQEVRDSLGKNKFRGIKIYPNLGYLPTDEKLMEIYAICEKGGYPVMAHCSPDGVWQLGLTREDRYKLSNPENYIEILTTFKKLNICLAHFGGQEEWQRHLKRRENMPGEKEAWVKTIYDMLASGKYPNLYTDISYTTFMPRLRGMYIDLIDYLKVLLSNKRVRSHVLFGSDFYMSEQEELSEKEVSIMLRSRLGEDLYFQIAHTNPMKYLGIRERKKSAEKK